MKYLLGSKASSEEANQTKAGLEKANQSHEFAVEQDGMRHKIYLTGAKALGTGGIDQPTLDTMRRLAGEHQVAVEKREPVVGQGSTAGAGGGTPDTAGAPSGDRG